MGGFYDPFQGLNPYEEAFGNPFDPRKMARTPPFLPTSSVGPPVPGSAAPQDQAGALDQLQGPRKRRRRIGDIAGGIGDILSAAATPNVAGGGSTDILRSLATGAQLREQRELRREQQDLADYKANLERIRIEAAAEEDRERARLARKQQEATEAKARRELEAAEEERKRPFITVGGSVYDKATGKRLEEIPKQYRSMEEERTLAKIRADEEIRKAEALAKLQPPKPPARWAPTSMAEAQQFEQYKATLRPRGGGGGGGGGGGLKPATRQQFAQVEEDKEKALAKAEDDYLKELRKLRDEGGTEQDYAEIKAALGRKKASAQQLYQNQIRTLGGTVSP